MENNRILKTEMRNPYSMHIDQMTTGEMIACIQRENEKAVAAVGAVSEQIEKACDTIANHLSESGRLVYVGAGTSGRLGVLDAAECPPTFGVPRDLVIGIIAGGEKCLSQAAEQEEDHAEFGERDLKEHKITEKDVIVGISASGNAEYVVGALKYAKHLNCSTVCITSNEGTLITKYADIQIVVDTGAEVITGSTRMKAGTAQKLILNTLSTVAMIKLGKVYKNMMINLRPTNEKLTKRMVRIVMEISGADEKKSIELLKKSNWNIKKAVEMDKA